MAVQKLFVTFLTVSLLAALEIHAAGFLGTSKADIESGFSDPEPGYRMIDGRLIKDLGVDAITYRPNPFKFRRVTFGFISDKVAISHIRYMGSNEKLSWREVNNSLQLSTPVSTGRRKKSIKWNMAPELNSVFPPVTNERVDLTPITKAVGSRSVVVFGQGRGHVVDITPWQDIVPTGKNRFSKTSTLVYRVPFRRSDGKAYAIVDVKATRRIRSRELSSGTSQPRLRIDPQKIEAMTMLTDDLFWNFAFATCRQPLKSLPEGRRPFQYHEYLRANVPQDSASKFQNRRLLAAVTAAVNDLVVPIDSVLVQLTDVPQNDLRKFLTSGIKKDNPLICVRKLKVLAEVGDVSDIRVCQKLLNRKDRGMREAAIEAMASIAKRNMLAYPKDPNNIAQWVVWADSLP